MKDLKNFLRKNKKIVFLTAAIPIGMINSWLLIPQLAAFVILIWIGFDLTDTEPEE
jgi:hypothetical protein